MGSGLSRRLLRVLAPFDWREEALSWLWFLRQACAAHDALKMRQIEMMLTKANEPMNAPIQTDDFDTGPTSASHLVAFLRL
jgi:hypothetical protein